LLTSWADDAARALPTGDASATSVVMASAWGTRMITCPGSKSLSATRRTPHPVVGGEMDTPSRRKLGGGDVGWVEMRVSEL
jgi:hypothetical protein